MGNLKSNIDHYMQLKGIRMYSHLLVDIAYELGIKGQDAYKIVMVHLCRYVVFSERLSHDAFFYGVGLAVFSCRSRWTLYKME